jgi:presenilin-like A22 family membrane protease
MFLITQFIGLYVVDHYSSVKIVDGNLMNVSAPSLPYGMESPEIEGDKEFNQIFVSIIFAFIFAIVLLFLLMKFKAEFVLKLWFFLVVMIALGISFNAFLSVFEYASIMAIIIALPLAFVKIYKREFLVHNLTELVIYPGIAAVFVPILNLYTIILLLIIISIYDVWAVWHSGIMQKMAKYQINTLNVFSGFFVPYVSKKVKLNIQNMNKEELKKKKVKVNVAILGGGDVIFPIITAGVALKTFGFVSFGSFLVPVVSLFVILGATVGLGYLLFSSEKKKFYPAMPFITAGIFAGMILGYLLV